VVGQGGIQLAALEIAKAIATGFRTELRDHDCQPRPAGRTIAKHYVAARPQCPTCGRKKLRDRAGRGADQPGPGAKLVMTKRGIPDRVVADHGGTFRKHVSPLTGVVTRLERIEADLP